MLKIKLLVLTTVSIFLSVAAPYSALAATDCTNPQTAQALVQCGVNQAAGGNEPKDPAASLSHTIGEIISIFSLAIGAIAVIMIVYAGLRFVISAGNPESAKNARNIVLYAVVGLIVAAIAQILVHFVLFHFG